MKKLLLLLLVALPLSSQPWHSYSVPGNAFSYTYPINDPVSGYSIWPMAQAASGPNTIQVNSLRPLLDGVGTWGNRIVWSGSGQFVYTSLGLNITSSSGTPFLTEWGASNSLGLGGSGIALPEGPVNRVVNVVTDSTHLSIVSGSGGSGNGYMVCPQMTPTAPPDGHWIHTFVVDPVRNRAYQYGQVCASTEHKFLTWYITLNSNPATDVFHPVLTTTHPTDKSGIPNGISIFDNNADVIVHHQSTNTESSDWWVFAPTIGGILSAKQLAFQTLIGKTLLADDYTEISDVIKNSAGTLCNASPSTCPLGQFQEVEDGRFVPSLNRILLTAADTFNGTLNQYWLWDSSTLRFTQVSTSGTLPGGSWQSNTDLYLAMDLNTNDGYMYYYHDVDQHFWRMLPSATLITWTDLGQFVGGPNYFATHMLYNAPLNQFQLTGCIFPSTCSDDGGAILWTISLPNIPTLSVPLTVQERLYPGDQTGHIDRVYTVSGGGGLARTSEPFCQGVPIKDSDAITSTSTLSTNASAGQFRIMSHWPSGNAKWIEVCTIAGSVSAAGTTLISFTNGGGGSGNFGGSNLATDNGTTISVATGTATFTLKKANHNGLDIVDVGATHVVLTGTSIGLVLLGPDGAASYPGNVTCLPDSGGSTCNHSYSLLNDTSSTCSIEKNGPVQAVIKCSGTLKDSGAHSYMKTDVRYYFNKNRANVKLTTILKNADYTAGDTNNFHTAYKGHKGWEFHTGLNITSPTYIVGCETNGTSGGSPSGCSTGSVTGTLTGSDSIYLYQAESAWMHLSNWCTGSSGCVPYTTDTGYTIVKTTSGTPATISSDTTQFQNSGVNLGWANIETSGIGVLIGVPDAPGVGMKSLEFRNGGTEAVIGLMAPQNSQPWYIGWPLREIQESVLEFHATTYTAGASATAFQKLQAPLIGRADFSYYNATSVFPWTIISPTEGDSWNLATAAAATPGPVSPSAACCVKESGFNGFIGTHLYQDYSAGGGNNQTEFYNSYMLNWINRGFSGRYLDALYGYRTLASHGWESADFTGGWRGQLSVIDSQGFVNNCSLGSGCFISSANYGKAGQNWRDPGGAAMMEHFHWYGLPDFYFMTGDETMKEGILSTKDWFLAPFPTEQGDGRLETTRSHGIFLQGAARLYTFLASISDTDAPAVLAAADRLWGRSISNVLCLSGYPAACTPSLLVFGTSYTRGALRASFNDYSSGAWCGSSSTGTNNRLIYAYHVGINAPGMLEYLRAKYTDPNDPAYLSGLDLVYGSARELTTELYITDGTGHYATNGWTYGAALDLPNNVNGDLSCDWTGGPFTAQTIHLGMLPLYMVDGAANTNGWVDKITINWQRVLNGAGGVTSAADYDAYTIDQMIHTINNLGTHSLQAVTPTIVENSGCASGQGSGHYCVTWSTPTGTTQTRVKYSDATHTIVDSLGFNIVTNTFAGSPGTQTAWFAATNASSIPTPIAGSQSMTINTGVTGMTASNFSVKVMAPNGCSLSPTTLGPWTNTQTSGYGSLIASGCAASSYTCSGLPTGLSVNSSTGAITGTISGATTYSATCSYDIVVNQPYSIVVNAVPTITTSSPLPAGNVTVLYSQTLATSGGTAPFTWTTVGGTIPTGLTFTSGGVLTGTPSTTSGSPFSFDARATDVFGVFDTKTFSVTINGGSSSVGGSGSAGILKSTTIKQ